jgi:hypothetical protein
MSKSNTSSPTVTPAATQSQNLLPANRWLTSILPEAPLVTNFILPLDFVERTFEELLDEVNSEHNNFSASFPATLREIKTIAKRHLPARLTQELAVARGNRLLEWLPPRMRTPFFRQALITYCASQIRVEPVHQLGSRQPLRWRVLCGGAE